MKYMLMIMVAVMANIAIAKDVYVNGYTRKDGTYVQPHHRSAPDNNQYNNWSTQGNVNPYTGRAGTVTPQPNYAPQPYQQQNGYGNQSPCMYGQRC